MQRTRGSLPDRLFRAPPRLLPASEGARVAALLGGLGEAQDSLSLYSGGFMSSGATSRTCCAKYQ